MQGGAAGVGQTHRTLPSPTADHKHLQWCLEGQVQETGIGEGANDRQGFGKISAVVAGGAVGGGLEDVDGDDLDIE